MSESLDRLNFLTGTDNEGRRRRFERQESDLAAMLGGRTTIGSGNKGMKGDAHVSNEHGQRVMAEAKSTEGLSISLKLAWLEKLVREALQAGMRPMLTLRFTAAKIQAAQDWAMVPLDRYEELLETEAKYQDLCR